MKTRLFVVATTMLGFAAVGHAQDKPCMADAARLCANIEPGGGAQIACLKEHKEELSPACKKKVMQMKIQQMEQQELQKQETPPQAPEPTPSQP
jgi:hypothetical protein